MYYLKAVVKSIPVVDIQVCCMRGGHLNINTFKDTYEKIEASYMGGIEKCKRQSWRVTNTFSLWRLGTLKNEICLLICMWLKKSVHFRSPRKLIKFNVHILIYHIVEHILFIYVNRK